MPRGDCFFATESPPLPPLPAVIEEVTVSTESDDRRRDASSSRLRCCSGRWSTRRSSGASFQSSPREALSDEAGGMLVTTSVKMPKYIGWYDILTVCNVFLENVRSSQDRDELQGLRGHERLFHMSPPFRRSNAAALWLAWVTLLFSMLMPEIMRYPAGHGGAVATALQHIAGGRDLSQHSAEPGEYGFEKGEDREVFGVGGGPEAGEERNGEQDPRKDPSQEATNTDPSTTRPASVRHDNAGSRGWDFAGFDDDGVGEVVALGVRLKRVEGWEDPSDVDPRDAAEKSDGRGGHGAVSLERLRSAGPELLPLAWEPGPHREPSRSRGHGVGVGGSFSEGEGHGFGDGGGAAMEGSSPGSVAHVGAAEVVPISGQGQREYADGSYYWGSFVRGRRHGTGKLCQPLPQEPATTATTSSASLGGDSGSSGSGDGGGGGGGGSGSSSGGAQACYEGQWANDERNG